MLTEDKFTRDERNDYLKRMGRTTLYDELGQYAPIPFSVIEMAKELGDGLILYCYLVRYRNNQENNANRGYSWRGYETISADLGWSKRTISEAIKILIEKNLLIIEKGENRFGGNGKNYYRILYPKPVK